MGVARHDFAGRRGGQRPILALEHAALDLAPAHIFLDQDLAVVPERLSDRTREFLPRPGLADADRRAEASRLHEDRTAKLGDNRLKGRRVALWQSSESAGSAGRGRA